MISARGINITITAEVVTAMKDPVRRETPEADSQTSYYFS